MTDNCQFGMPRNTRQMGGSDRIFAVEII